ncbi:MAG: NeuD/PglB/VioB family sugar acetyltransferase, partial [Deltaproteobacteria bacterium]|nr:NeuD/PglB/VioB family sugar acetyltransferase [Deltaproteobacteria bacterium]
MGNELEKLVILGTGLFAQEVLDLAEDTGKYEVTAFVENWDKNKAGKALLDRPIVWIEDISSIISTHKAVCALGSTHRRGFIEQAKEIGFEFTTIIHPSSRISSQSIVKEGSIISAGVDISAHTTIGNHVIINRGGLIGHHTKIGDYTTISPGVNIAGSVTIGEGTFIGIGAIVLDHLRIGAHSVVGAGALVTRDVSDRVQVIGIP